MTHPGAPPDLSPAQTAPLLGLTTNTLKRYRAQGLAPVATVVGGGTQRSRVRYSWDSINAWLSARGRAPVAPHCPCCGRP